MAQREPISIDDPEESLYRRRQKAVVVRRSPFSRLVRVVLWTLLPAVVLGSLVLIGFLVRNFVLTSPLFDLTSAADVIVSGNAFVSREEILNAMSIPLSAREGNRINIFRISLDKQRRQVESIPWVRAAAITRILPNRLSVKIVERTPIAFVNAGGRLELIDADGVFLEKPEKAQCDFPVVGGLDDSLSRSERKARLTLYQDFMRQLSARVPAAGWNISEVDLFDANDVKSVLVRIHETVLVHFGDADFSERFQNFLALLPELRKSNVAIESVDLRYRNQIVVNPSPAGAQAGQGQPSARTQKD